MRTPQGVKRKKVVCSGASVGPGGQTFIHVIQIYCCCYTIKTQGGPQTVLKELDKEPKSGHGNHLPKGTFSRALAFDLDFCLPLGPKHMGSA